MKRNYEIVCNILYFIFLSCVIIGPILLLIGLQVLTETQSLAKAFDWIIPGSIVTFIGGLFLAKQAFGTE